MAFSPAVKAFQIFSGLSPVAIIPFVTTFAGRKVVKFVSAPPKLNRF